MKVIIRSSKKPVTLILGGFVLLGSIAIPAYDYVGRTNQYILAQDTKIELLYEGLNDISDTLCSINDEMIKKDQIIHDQNIELDTQKVKIEELKKHISIPMSRGTIEPIHKKLTVEATAYSYTGSKTKTGTWPKIGTIAVDPKVIPLGSRIYVPGYGYGVAEDTGGAIHGHIIDLFMTNVNACKQWGRKKVTITILK